MKLLTSRIGFCLYLLLPNRWVWGLLSNEERARVEAGNLHHNTHRPDFADPTAYANGMSFDVDVGVESARRHERLVELLDRVKPATVLEIGPGSGHLTRAIVTHSAVRRYVAVDINGAFLEYLRERLVKIERPGFSFDLVEGTIDEVPLEQFDAVILLSTVHHIPDRAGLFRALAARLSPDGRIFAVDPTHYFLRWWHLVRKVARRGYLSNAVRKARRGILGTHAMCQWAEYRALARRTQLRVVQVSFDARPRRIEQLRARGIPLGLLARWMAQEIAIECGPERRTNKRLASIVKG